MHFRHDSIACAPSAKFAASTILGWHSRQLPIRLVISSDCTALQAVLVGSDGAGIGGHV